MGLCQSMSFFILMQVFGHVGICTVGKKKKIYIFNIKGSHCTGIYVRGTVWPSFIALFSRSIDQQVCFCSALRSSSSSLRTPINRVYFWSRSGSPKIFINTRLAPSRRPTSVRRCRYSLHTTHGPSGQQDQPTTTFRRAPTLLFDVNIQVKVNIVNRAAVNEGRRHARDFCDPAILTSLRVLFAVVYLQHIRRNRGSFPWFSYILIVWETAVFPNERSHDDDSSNSSPCSSFSILSLSCIFFGKSNRRIFIVGRSEWNERAR